MMPQYSSKLRKKFAGRLRGLYDLLTGCESEHWARVEMNRQITAWIVNLEPARLDALEVSGSHWGTLISFKSYETVSYPEYDLCEGPLGRSYDFVIADQIFEHLADPNAAASSVYRMVRPGGYFLISTPFLLRVHEQPIDCCRWTETGLRYLLERSGFPDAGIRTGSWGNRACVEANLKGWVRYRRRIHSLKNEPGVPVVTWAMAQRGLA
jgi:SAM-dependent methyltransferase